MKPHPFEKRARSQARSLPPRSVVLALAGGLPLLALSVAWLQSLL